MQSVSACSVQDIRSCDREGLVLLIKDLVKKQQIRSWKEYKDDGYGFSLKYPSFLFQDKEGSNILSDREDVVQWTIKTVDNVDKYYLEDKPSANVMRFNRNQKKWISNYEGDPLPKKIDEKLDAYIYQTFDGPGVMDMIIVFDGSYSKAVEINISIRTDGDEEYYKSLQTDPYLVALGVEYNESNNTLMEGGDNDAILFPEYVPSEIKREVNRVKERIQKIGRCSTDADWSNVTISHLELDGNEVVALKLNCYSDYYLFFIKSAETYRFIGEVDGGYDPFIYPLENAVTGQPVIFGTVLEKSNPVKFLKIGFHSSYPGAMSNGDIWYGIDKSGQISRIFLSSNGYTKGDLLGIDGVIIDEKDDYDYLERQGKYFIIKTTETITKELNTSRIIDKEAKRNIYVWDEDEKYFTILNNK
jgi:hypothetical protein